jgi:hypothetical protein
MLQEQRMGEKGAHAASAGRYSKFQWPGHKLFGPSVSTLQEQEQILVCLAVICGQWLAGFRSMLHFYHG